MDGYHRRSWRPATAATTAPPTGSWARPAPTAGCVPGKVDREERPDLDSVYMAAVQAMTGSGGWPMSVFLTPDGRPFYGGADFPLAPRPSPAVHSAGRARA